MYDQRDFVATGLVVPNYMRTHGNSVFESARTTTEADYRARASGHNRTVVAGARTLSSPSFAAARMSLSGSSLEVNAGETAAGDAHSKLPKPHPVPWADDSSSELSVHQLLYMVVAVQNDYANLKRLLRDIKASVLAKRVSCLDVAITPAGAVPQPLLLLLLVLS